MAKKQLDQYMVNEHVLEVRYDSSVSFLTGDGQVADYIRSVNLFPHWKIDANIVNFFDTPLEVKQLGAFIAFNRAGYIVKNPDTQNFFQEKAIAFWAKFLENNVFPLPEVDRFGTRTKIFLSSDKPFEEVNQAVYEKFITADARKTLGGAESDLTYLIKLEDGGFTLNVLIGPLHKGEAEKFLSFKSERFSSTGLILDIDCYIQDRLSPKDIPRLLRDAMTLTWDKANKIAKFVGL